MSETAKDIRARVTKLFHQTLQRLGMEADAASAYGHTLEELTFHFADTAQDENVLREARFVPVDLPEKPELAAMEETYRTKRAQLVPKFFTHELRPYTRKGYDILGIRRKIDKKQQRQQQQCSLDETVYKLRVQALWGSMRRTPLHRLVSVGAHFYGCMTSSQLQYLADPMYYLEQQQKRKLAVTAPKYAAETGDYCKHCKRKEVHFLGSLQIRSADEPMTSFYQCQECGAVTRRG
jgi:DNA-directed RNA polymerase subunit M/transcription elongation factor TFIIS